MPQQLTLHTLNVIHVHSMTQQNGCACMGLAVSHTATAAATQYLLCHRYMAFDWWLPTSADPGLTGRSCCAVLCCAAKPSLGTARSCITGQPTGILDAQLASGFACIVILFILSSCLGLSEASTGTFSILSSVSKPSIT